MTTTLQNSQSLVIQLKDKIEYAETGILSKLSCYAA
jgi:hypothetical protein